MKMAELDQQMMMEHRNKKKTQKYYRKLVDATKTTTKGITDFRVLHPVLSSRLLAVSFIRVCHP